MTTGTPKPKTAMTWKDVTDSWSGGRDECKDRIYGGLRMKAILYVVVFVWLIGGIGVWVSALMNMFGAAAPRDVLLSILTFAVAVAVTGAFDGMYPHDSSQFIRIVAILAAIIASAIPAGLLLWWYLRHPDLLALPTERFNDGVTLLAPLPSILVWWFFNGLDARFGPDVTSNGSAGGDPMQKL